MTSAKSKTYQVRQEHLQSPIKIKKRKNEKYKKTRTWANAQRHGRPAEYRWRPLFDDEKFD